MVLSQIEQCFAPICLPIQAHGFFSKDKFVKYERSVRRRDSSLVLAGKEKQLRYSAAVTNVTE